MNRDQSILVVKRMSDYEIAVCGILNRISRPPKVLGIVNQLIGDFSLSSGPESEILGQGSMSFRGGVSIYSNVRNPDPFRFLLPLTTIVNSGERVFLLMTITLVILFHDFSTLRS